MRLRRSGGRLRSKSIEDTTERGEEKRGRRRAVPLRKIKKIN
jgi:hypothetical protein